MQVELTPFILSLKLRQTTQRIAKKVLTLSRDVNECESLAYGADDEVVI